jgi:hypothetical protein
MSLVALSPGTVTLTLLDADQTQQLVLEVVSPGPAGPAGSNGTNGTNGTAATIAAGTTTTLSPGSSASVTNSGSSSAATFDFGIPAGQTGATGATGAPGVGVPVGGSTAQALVKASGANYDTTWSTIVSGDRYLTSSTTRLARVSRTRLPRTSRFPTTPQTICMVRCSPTTLEQVC